MKKILKWTRRHWLWAVVTVLFGAGVVSLSASWSGSTARAASLGALGLAACLIGYALLTRSMVNAFYQASTARAVREIQDVCDTAMMQMGGVTATILDANLGPESAWRRKLMEDAATTMGAWAEISVTAMYSQLGEMVRKQRQLESELARLREGLR